MRILHTAVGSFTDPTQYNDAYANANFDKLQDYQNQLFKDAMTQSQQSYNASGYGNGIGSLGALNSIRAPYAAEAARGQANLWNMTQNNSMGWAANARANNSDYIQQNQYDEWYDQMERQKSEQRKQDKYGIGYKFGENFLLPAAMGIGTTALTGGLGGALGAAGGAEGMNFASGASNGLMNLFKFNADGNTMPNNGRPAALLDLRSTPKSLLLQLMQSGSISGTMNEVAPEAIVPLDRPSEAGQMVSEMYGNNGDQKSMLMSLLKDNRLGHYENGTSGNASTYDAADLNSLLPENDQSYFRSLYNKIAPKFGQRNIRREVDTISNSLPNTKLGTIADIFNPVKIPSWLRKHNDISIPDSSDKLGKDGLQNLVNAWKKQYSVQSKFMSDREIGKNLLNYYYNYNEKDVPQTESGQDLADLTQTESGTTTPDSSQSLLMELMTQPQYTNPYDRKMPDRPEYKELPERGKYGGTFGRDLMSLLGNHQNEAENTTANIFALLGKNYKPKTSSGTMLAAIMDDNIARRDKRTDTDYTDALTKTQYANDNAQQVYEDKWRELNYGQNSDVFNNAVADKTYERKLNALDTQRKAAQQNFDNNIKLADAISRRLAAGKASKKDLDEGTELAKKLKERIALEADRGKRKELQRHLVELENGLQYGSN
jgi:hypothetical protein